MAEDLLSLLARFHRDVVLPDIERVVDQRVRAAIVPFRDDVMSNFDAVYQRFDRLESEYVSLKSAVRRIEE